MLEHLVSFQDNHTIPFHFGTIEVKRGEDNSGTTSGGVILLSFFYTPQRFCTVDSGKEKGPKKWIRRRAYFVVVVVVVVFIGDHDTFGRHSLHW